jgi:hypothetical protein
MDRSGKGDQPNTNYDSPQLQTGFSHEPILKIKMLLLVGCLTFLIIMSEVAVVEGMDQAIKAGAKLSTSDPKSEHTASLDIKAGKAQENIMGTATSKRPEKVGYAYPYYAPSPPIPVYQPHERKSGLSRLASKLKNYYFSFKMEFERFCSLKWLKDLFRTSKF